MHEVCRQSIVEILQNHLSLIRLAVCQRAKFEGWLKFELAAHIEGIGATSVEVESSFDNNKRSDIAFQFNGVRYDLELKTPNTNYRIEGIENKHRPITKNIDGITLDALKLHHCPGGGIVAFALFPVPSNDNRWRRYLTKISKELNISLSEDAHCTRVIVPLGDKQTCDVIVCCFSYPCNI